MLIRGDLKIAVLGSNSFSGSHFVNFGLQGNHKVIGFSRSEELPACMLPYKAAKAGEFHFFQRDINRDLPQIMSVLDDFQPHYVVNFAAQGMVAESWAQPADWFQTNVVGMVRLHDELRKRTYLKKYVHISTPEVYGSCEGLVKEEAPFNPSTPYAVSRAAAEMSLRSFLKQYGFPVVFTRAANVFGPGQQLYRIVPRTFMCGRTGQKLQLHGGGHSVRSFIDIRDVVRGTFDVMLHGAVGEAYHLSTSRNISIRHLVETMADMMRLPFSDLVDVVAERPGKDAAYLLDSSKLRALTGWPTNTGNETSLEQGLLDTLSWVDENLGELRLLPQQYVHKV